MMNITSSTKWITLMRFASLVLAVALTVILLLSIGLVWFNLAFATAAVLFGALTLFGQGAGCRTIVACGLAGGTLLGGVGFVLGYFKPGLFGAEGNLAPLTGIFWTGPMGVVAGAVLGLVVGSGWVFHRRPIASDNPQP